MPTEVLTQLRALRENIAETLRKDPRFLTLSALDRSIAEITGVLTTSGLLPPEPPPPPSPLHFDAPTGTPPVRAAPPAEASAPVAPAAKTLSAAAAPMPAATPAPIPPVAASGAPAKKKKKSILQPVAGTAAALAAAGAAAEAVHLSLGKAAAETPADDHAANADPESASADSEAGAEEGDTKSHAVNGTAASHAANGTMPPGEADEPAAADSVVPEGKASGYVPMQAKAGAAQYQPAISVKFGKLPNKVDLRPLMTPIEDQGETSSCVANAVAGAYEYWIKKATKQDTNISRLFVYYNARWRDNSQDKDGGSVIQLAMEGLSKFGACNEKVWPFDTRLVVKKPGADAYKDALPWRVQDMQQVPLKLDAWKQALAEGKPIVFGIALFDSFDKCSQRGGVVEMPSPEDVARATHSGHSMCAVGYSDSEKVFIVRNSWDTDWGDKGYCYMPYAYLLNPKFNDSDCWVFVPKVPMQPPREVWSDDTTPVTNDGKGVDFPIETFKIEDYAHVAVDFFERVRRPFNAVVGEDFSQYVSFAAQGLWTEMESFDYRTFLASTAALTGVAATTSAFASEFSSTSETSSTETSEDLVSSEEDLESDEEQDEDETVDESEDAEEESEDEESEEDDAEDDDSEDESEEDTDESEDDAEAEADADEDESDDAEEDADEDEDDSEDDEADEADEDSDESEDDDAEDDSDEDEGDDAEDESDDGDDGDDGDDEGGDDGDD